MNEVGREKRELAWNRYLARKAVHLARERRNGQPVGKVMAELKRRVTLAVDRVRETIVPTDDPWTDDNFFGDL